MTLFIEHFEIVWNPIHFDKWKVFEINAATNGFIFTQVNDKLNNIRHLSTGHRIDLLQNDK